ncbi:hypothetical protein [uncultured Treponema sp.]|uniref:hypothetical protein n=1 Tax=uncultured Treponema sp. TaxID=162155 RepID=UPI0025DFBEE9|nr:hypothetical protein [uncultured Treponema sp.]
MVSISDFLRISKIDSCKHLSTGMRYSDYIKWAGFYLPPYSNFDIKSIGTDKSFGFWPEFFDYTHTRVGTAHDLLLLFCHSISESVCENVKVLNGTVNVNFISKCRNATEFVDVVKNAAEKYSKQIQINPFLGINTDKENNITLATMLLESGVFKGIELYGSSFADNPEKFLGIFNTARKMNLKSRISCLGCRTLKTHEEIFELMQNLHPTHLLNPNIAFNYDDLEEFKSGKIFPEIISFSKDNNIHVEFSPAPILSVSEEKAKLIREVAENDIPFSLCTEDLLFLNKSISEFAVDLCNAGIFSKDEMVKIISNEQ